MLITVEPAAPRFDFSIENESADIFLAAWPLSQNIRTKKQRQKAIEAGQLLNIPLAEGAAFNGRVVLGDLDEVESSHWIARCDAVLDLPTGQLVVDNGPYICTKKVRAHEVGESFQLFTVEPGATYHITVYALLNSVSGSDLLRLDPSDGYLSYCLTSWPNQPVPDWVVDMADDNDEEIPDDLTLRETNADRLIDFLIQLQPAGEETPISPRREDGSLAWKVRKPGQFPRGILSSQLAAYRTQKAKALAAISQQQWQEKKKADEQYTAAKQDTKQTREYIIQKFAAAGEAFRERKFDEFTSHLTEGIRDEFPAFIEEQLSKLASEGKQVDPLNPLFASPNPTREAVLDLWQLRDEFNPVPLLDIDAANQSDHCFDLIWNYRDPQNQDIFDFSHKVSVTLLVVCRGENAEIAGIQIE